MRFSGNVLVHGRWHFILFEPFCIFNEFSTFHASSVTRFAEISPFYKHLSLRQFLKGLFRIRQNLEPTLETKFILGIGLSFIVVPKWPKLNV